VRRRRLFAFFCGFRDYTNAVLAEHGNYVRCSSSYCVRIISPSI